MLLYTAVQRQCVCGRSIHIRASITTTGFDHSHSEERRNSLSRTHLEPGVEPFRPLENVGAVAVHERPERGPFLVDAAQHVKVEVAAPRLLVPLAAHLHAAQPR